MVRAMGLDTPAGAQSTMTEWPLGSSIGTAVAAKGVLFSRWSIGA